MTNKVIKNISMIFFAVLMTACSTSAFDNDNENAARNKGAVGGTLLGASLGLLIGDPTLALQGAAIGGIAGAVGGTMEDTESARENKRNQVLAESVAEDKRSEAELRVAELEAQIKLMELQCLSPELQETS